MKQKIIEKLWVLILGSAFIFFIGMVASVFVFLLLKSWPFFEKFSFFSFVLGTHWLPSGPSPSFEIGAFLVSTIWVSSLALLWAVLFGIFAAIFISEYCSKNLRVALKIFIGTISSLPSIIYGLMGIVFLVPLIRKIFPSALNTGYNLLSSSIILALMVIPIILSFSLQAFENIGREQKEAAFSLGATRLETSFKIILPSSIPGIFTGMILAFTRAIGETVAVLVVSGNVPLMPSGFLSPIRTLTMNIVTDFSYASGDHLNALFATALILCGFVLFFNIILFTIQRKIFTRKNA